MTTIAGATMLLLLGASSRAQEPDNCAALASTNFSTLPDAPTTITSVRLVPETDDLPAFCRVEGYVAPEVMFELRLPSKNWNSKFLMQGCGGLCGIIKIQAADDALARGYAVSTTNMGHTGTTSSGIWGYNNRPAEIDFGYRSTHATAVASKAIVDAYYSQQPEWSYFRGCSTGGRQGMVEAQRYPADFDGIIAGAPVLNETGIGALHLLWSVRANLDADGESILDGSQMTLLHRATLDRCDALDGVADGILNDPRQCDFDPGELSCTTAEGSACLTEAQVDVVRKLYGGPKNSAGQQLYPGGLMKGSEYEWSPALIGVDGEPALAMTMPLIGDFLRYLAFYDDPGPGYGITDFDFDRDPPRLAFMEAIYSGSNPDLTGYQARGGKILIYQGWDDLEVTPSNTVRYYELATRTMGGPDATQDFFRLFMLPGVAHCRRGPGADAYDYLSYLEAWVEQNQPPDIMIGAHLKKEQPYDGLPPLRYPLSRSAVEFTRPVFPYPAVAGYSGTGDVNDAANWIGTDDPDTAESPPQEPAPGD